jgi:hypothetical protein
MAASTTTFTISVQNPGVGWPEQGPVAHLPALRNRRGFAMSTRHAFTGGMPTILRVTNANASGVGSLQAAWEATGNRIVVFETSGTIDLAGGHLRTSAGGGRVNVEAYLLDLGEAA